MKVRRALLKVLEQTKDLLLSYDYLCRSRIKSTYFTRLRKLSFFENMLFILSSARNSLQGELNHYLDMLNRQDETYSKQAFSKGRQRIKPEAFKELVDNAVQTTYEQLFRNLAPITLHEAEMYRGKMDTYGTEDFLQEGIIVAWEIISRGNFKGGKFSTYFGAAIRNRLIRIWRDYNLKNLVCIGESEDCRGNITRILVESDYAKEYRIKKAEQNKRWYEKKKASQPPKEKKPPMTKEELSRKVCAYQKEYYAAHPDKMAERREKNRIAEKARRERKKAERLAAQEA